MAGKRHKKNLESFDISKKHLLDEAFQIVDKFEAPKFDETINVAFRLGVDVKQADQQVRVVPSKQPCCRSKKQKQSVHIFLNRNHQYSEPWVLTQLLHQSKEEFREIRISQGSKIAPLKKGLHASLEHLL
jgi:hypothetical protein